MDTVLIAKRRRRVQIASLSLCVSSAILLGAVIRPGVLPWLAASLLVTVFSLGFIGWLASSSFTVDVLSRLAIATDPDLLAKKGPSAWERGGSFGGFTLDERGEIDGIRIEDE